ncbi:MAG TPA: universal stress protein [Mycobacteriales bacterium]
MADDRPIVVGVDGSQGSHAAVQWAAEEAARRDRPLRVVHATVPTHLPTMRSVAVATTTEWKQQAEKVAADGAVAARRLHPTLTVERKVHLNQNPAQALADEAESAELLVLGARGSGGFARLRLGSTAVQLLELASGPVVIVREPGADVMPGPAAGQVVVGVDGSELSRRAVRFGLGEAAQRGTGLTAVHAWTAPWHPALRSFEASGGVDWSFLEPQAAAILSESVAGAREEFSEVEVTERLVNDQPGDALLDASRGAELLVVGSRGLGGLTGLVLGSVSHGAVHQAHCSVAVVR